MDAYQEQFKLRQKTPAYWHNKSQDLCVSARTLWVAMQDNESLEATCLSTYKMLMGMSFELLFKAHCVGARIIFEDTHKLEALACKAELPTSKDENRILRVLSEYVIWDGRYPTPKKPQHLENHWENQNQVLYNNEKLGNLTVRVSNEKLDFEGLLPIWRRCSDLFMDKYS